MKRHQAAAFKASGYALVGVLAAVLAGWALGSGWWAFAVMAGIWLVRRALDGRGRSKLLAYLRQPGTETDEGRGRWAELLLRTHRLWRLQQREVKAQADKLDGFLSAIQASPNGVLLLDAEGRIEWCNQTAAQLLGLQAQRDVGQHLSNLLRDPDFVHYAQTPEGWAEDCVLGRGYGAAALRVALRLHPYGEHKRLLLARDVTALERAQAMRTDFVANVSHEVRTPLAALQVGTETLQNLPLSDAERQQVLASMAEQCARMDALVTDLLQLSTLEARPTAGMEQRTAVFDLLSKAEQQIKETQRHPIEFIQKCTWNGVSVPPWAEAGGQWHALQLHANTQEALSALVNLLGNACRYATPGTPITLQADFSADGLVLSVIDQGPGISPEHLPRLTERFYRVDSGRSRASGGTGLGLAIVKHIMQRHGGELRIESTVGQGSRFSLLWPAARLTTVSAELL